MLPDQLEKAEQTALKASTKQEVGERAIIPFLLKANKQVNPDFHC